MAVFIFPCMWPSLNSEKSLPILEMTDGCYQHVRNLMVLFQCRWKKRIYWLMVLRCLKLDWGMCWGTPRKEPMYLEVAGIHQFRQVGIGEGWALFLPLTRAHSARNYVGQRNQLWHLSLTYTSRGCPSNEGRHWFSLLLALRLTRKCNPRHRGLVPSCFLCLTEKQTSVSAK